MKLVVIVSVIVAIIIAILHSLHANPADTIPVANHDIIFGETANPITNYDIINVETTTPFAIDSIPANSILRAATHGEGPRLDESGHKKIKWDRVKTVREFDRETREVVGTDTQESVPH